MAGAKSAATKSLTPVDFAAAMAGFRLLPGAQIAVAVSGGADSLALVRLLAAWAPIHKITVQALTVDHGLRDAATDEAAQVGTWLAALEIPHATLYWEEGRALRGLARSAQSAAREARYRLMTDWCATNGCTHLFVAHHADDQVETFLLRLARGSGVDGLAAMAPASVRDGIVIARPLLTFAKEQLTAFCRDMGQAWIEDPSNANPASGRVRFREARQVLEREGLTRDRLLATVGHLQRARAALDYAGAGLLAQGSIDTFGVARLPVAAVLAAPEEIGLRAVARVLTAVSGQEFTPRFETLARLYARLTVGPWRDATLHGSVVRREGGDIVITREPAQVGEDKTLSNASAVIWDSRFRLSLCANQPRRFTVAAFDGQRLTTESERAALVEIPLSLRGTVPALFDEAGLAAVPHTGYMRADVAALQGLSLGLTMVSSLLAGADAKL